MMDFSFARKKLRLANGIQVTYYSLRALEDAHLGNITALPYSIRVLLEGALRRAGQHPAFDTDHVVALAQWPTHAQRADVPFLPARILLQDFTGVPCLADLAALRSQLSRVGRDPTRIEPRVPVDLVVDHSVQLDYTSSADALEKNIQLEFQRNAERYSFLRWAQGAFRQLTVYPPGLGICHQINLEYIAKVVTVLGTHGELVAIPDTVVGTDSHTTMINGLGVLGWGVGGIEAEGAMLDQPIPVLLPLVTGVHLRGRLRPGVTATDLALYLTRRLREANVVDQFVEFFGEGLDTLTLPDRATVANMAPEYGATIAYFPVDGETLRYLRETGRTADHIDLVERYCKEQGLFRGPEAIQFSRVLEVNLEEVDPAVAGPKKPHEHRSLKEVARSFKAALTNSLKNGGYGLKEEDLSITASINGHPLTHGSVVIASITSCTNTSNPYVMVAAGLLAAKAVSKGLRVPETVRASLAPGSRVVTAYLRHAGLLPYLEALGFHVAAYGCATCIGNSGPLPEPIEKAVREKNLVVAAVLSGNRNFEGRIHPLAKANYLCSPPLVIAYALAGTIAIDFETDPLGHTPEGQPVYLRDIWPTHEEIMSLISGMNMAELYRSLYGEWLGASTAWTQTKMQTGSIYEWDPSSTYIREPPFVMHVAETPAPLRDIRNARVLAWFGDFITTDHISPAGQIPPDSPAGQYLVQRGIAPNEFNTYGARRGNHEVMIRGTFANIRIRNRLVDREGGWTLHIPTQRMLTMFDAAMEYQKSGTPLLVMAGKMYGAGSSRDWAAKGPALLGVRAVLAESFERIHRSNLVEMGVLPLVFCEGESAESLGLTGHEVFHICGLEKELSPRQTLEVIAEAATGKTIQFRVQLRADSPMEIEYLRHGGILPYVYRQFLKEASST